LALKSFYRNLVNNERFESSSTCTNDVADQPRRPAHKPFLEHQFARLSEAQVGMVTSALLRSW
jgi:hypothetical protein